MSDTPKDAKGIFLAALDIQNPDERAAFVVRSCQGDDPLQKRVEDLLRAYGESGGPLDKMAAAIATTRLGEPIREQVGSTIGPYKLMEQIGEGGFGLVFVAEQQQPIRRKVALKIIKPGMDTRDVIARFEAERQALALMDHPNIARVLDAGTTESGRPYFVMELVRGIPITDYCDQAQLTPRERLELFVPVCNAIQHAHLKGIIHRDVKPSNVLVTLHDDRPVVKVIDFGVAKALYQSLTERTIYTRYAQMIGTPLYMSPEQAQMSGLDIDTRSDIYSLGVLLYELLTGSTPFNKERLAKAAYDELLKIIREEEPPKPSLRLSQSGDALPSIAAQRKTEPAKLSKMFRGDLDWIAMKALEKDRTRRYETANAFAADVLRYLNDEPVEATPPSAAYRIRKFARKHRGPTIALAVIVAVLLVGIGGTTWGLIRAWRAERAAIESERRAVNALDEVTEERDAKNRALSEAQGAREKAEHELANGLLRPIGFYAGEKETGGAEIISPAEFRSLIDWSAIKDGQLKLRVLEVAFESPDVALRVARRAERVIQACVGLSLKRRAHAIQFLAAKQVDREADPRIRVAACWLALELGSVERSAWSESCRYLAEPSNYLTDSCREFVTFSARQNDQLGLDPLVEILESTQTKAVQDSVCAVLPRFIAQMRTAQIKRAANAMLAILEKPRIDVFRKPVFAGLVTIAPRLDEPERARAQRLLLESLKEEFVDEPISLWAALAPQMSPEANKHAWQALLSTSRGATYLAKNETNEGKLRALAARQSSADTQSVWNALVAFAEKSEKQPTLDDGSQAMKALISRMTLQQAKQASATLIATVAKFPKNGALGLTLLAPRLESADAGQAWDAVLRATMTSTSEKDPSGIGEEYSPFPSLARALRALAPRLQGVQIDSAYRELIRTLQHVKAHSAKQAVMWRALEALAPHLAPSAAKIAWGTLLTFPQVDASAVFLQEVQQGEPFVALAQRLEPAELFSAAQSLIVDLEAAPFSHMQAIIALAPQIEHTLGAQAADKLITIGATSNNDRILRAVDDALVALAPLLDAEHAKRTWDTIIARPSRLYPLADEGEKRGFSKLASRLEARQLESVPKELIDLLSKPGDAGARDAVTEALSAVAPRLEASEIEPLQRELVALLENSIDLNTRIAAIRGIVALAPRVDARQVEALQRELITILEKSSDSKLRWWAIEVLASLAPKMEAPQTSRTGAALVAMLEGADLEMWNQVVKAMLVLAGPPGTHAPDRTCATAMKTLFDMSSGGIDVILEPRDTPLILGLSQRSLAHLLSHPACVGEPRRYLLQRFEEAIFYEGRTIFPGPGSPSKESSSIPLPPRRFNNLADAATWIQTNWPDFDLESTPAVTWHDLRRSAPADNSIDL
jgi:serine/threonine protein kinase